MMRLIAIILRYASDLYRYYYPRENLRMSTLEHPIVLHRNLSFGEIAMNPKLVASVVLVFAAAISVDTAHAGRKFGQIYRECGLGAMISPSDQTLALVSNITTDLGTTAILSNATTPDTCKGSSAKTALFIHESYDALASDLSRGEGKYLDSLASLNGWSRESQSVVTEQIRGEFATVVAANGYSDKNRLEKSEALFDIVAKHSAQS